MQATTGVDLSCLANTRPLARLASRGEFAAEDRSCNTELNPDASVAAENQEKPSLVVIMM